MSAGLTIKSVISVYKNAILYQNATFDERLKGRDAMVDNLCKRAKTKVLLLTVFLVACLVLAGCAGDTLEVNGNTDGSDGKSQLYKTVEQYMSDEFTRVYSPYYEILDLEIKNWQEDWQFGDILLYDDIQELRPRSRYRTVHYRCQEQQLPVLRADEKGISGAEGSKL